MLVRNHGRLVPKEQLLAEVWPDTFVDEANLNRSISVLRKALGDLPHEQRYIETVPKVGYRFVAAVTPAVVDEPMVADAPAPHRLRGRVIAATAVCAALVALPLWNDRAPADVADRRGEPSHRQVTFGGREGSPAMSPDGQWLAYISSDLDASLQRLMLRRVNGAEPAEIFSATGMSGIRWSPARREILFWARTAEWEGIHAIDLDAGRPRRLVPGL